MSVVVKGANIIDDGGNEAMDGSAEIVRLGVVVGVGDSIVDTKSLNITKSSMSNKESRYCSPVK